MDYKRWKGIIDWIEAEQSVKQVRTDSADLPQKMIIYVIEIKLEETAVV